MSKPDAADIPHSNESRQGVVYVMTHPFMRDTQTGGQLCKVGATRKHPVQRATELSAGTGVPGMFTVAYWAAAPDCFEVERLCHERFAEQRVDAAREFFAIPVADVVGYIRETIGSLTREGGEWLEQGMDASAAEQELPWSTLFASFDPDGPAELTAEEQGRCRALGARLR